MLDDSLSTAALVHLVRFQWLRELNISFNLYQCPSVSQIHRLLSALETSLSHVQFSKFHSSFVGVKKHGRLHAMPVGGVLAATALTPLFVFRNLTELQFMLPYRFHLDDATLHEMAVAWPKLQVLHLGHDGKIGDPKVTLQGLVSLATFCPELSSLFLVLHASAREGDIPSVSNNLEYFHVGLSTIDDPNTVAPFLKALFPHLTFLQYCTFIDEQSSSQRVSKWLEVLGCFITGERLNKIILGVIE
jgi:hypothetical protein